MIAYFSKSLIKQLNIIVLSSLIIGISILAVFVSYIVYQRIEGDRQKKLANTIALTKLSLQEPIWFMNSIAIEDVRDAVMLDSDVLAVRVEDEGKAVLSERVSEAYSDQTFEDLKNDPDSDLQEIELTRAGTVIGQVSLITTKHHSRVVVRKMIVLIVVGAVCAIVILGVMINLLGNRFIKKPVIELSNMALALSRGNLNVQIDTTRKDEVGVLAVAFDSMRNAIRDKIRAMTHLNASLEIMVNERTAELNKTNLELKEAKTIAELANESKSEFLQNMSHELRTPMHAILGFAKLSLERVNSINPEKMATYQKEIIAAGDRLFELLDTLIELSHMETGIASYHYTNCRISDLIHEGVIGVTPKAKEKNITIEYSAGNNDMTTLIDKEKMSQVIKNILGNSIKYSPAGKKVKIEQEVGEATTKISISDQGVGIPVDELESIFDIFSQSTTTKTGAGGTGIGLSVSRTIINRHNGRIWASNNEDGGATVTFIIPNKNSKLEEQEALS